ncbi:MAG: SPFH domain-containing protein [Chloroflexia bacterium]
MGNLIFGLFMIGIVIYLLVMGARSVKIQHEGRIGLVEAWGRFARVVPPGRYILWPWEHISGELPLQIHEWETPPQKLMLRGGTPLTLSAVIYYQIEHAHSTPGAPRPPRIMGSSPPPVGSYVDTPALPASSPTVFQNHSGIGIDSLEPAGRAGRRTPPARTGSAPATIIGRIMGQRRPLDITQAAFRAKYMVRDWKEATEKEAVAVLQNLFSKIAIADDITGDINWQETLGERVREHLTEKTERWGVQIIDVTFKDAALSEMTLQNLHAEPRAERESRVRIKEAESYKKVAEILGLSQSDLLHWRQVEIMRELSKSPQPRVMFTSGMTPGGDAAPANAAGPMNPMLAGDRGAAPQLGGPALNGYLGTEPPIPALSPEQMAASRGIPQPESPAAGDSGMVAPSLQNIDQQ